jgi:hypothetical protein
MGYCKNENTWSCGIRFLDKAQPAGVNRRAVSDAQTSVRRAAAVSKKDAKASKSFATDSRSEIRAPTRIPDSGGIMPTLRFTVGESILINTSTATRYGRRVSYFFWETPFKIAPLEVEIVVRKLDDFRRLGPGAVAGS